MFQLNHEAVRGRGARVLHSRELLIVILIVGILAAVAIPLYLGYTKDAKLAEGKALLGSVMTALQGCVQAKGSGQSCAVSEIVNRVGVSTAGVTGDGRWTVTTSGSLAVSSASPPTSAAPSRPPARAQIPSRCRWVFSPPRPVSFSVAIREQHSAGERLGGEPC